MERKYIFFKTSRGFWAPFFLFWLFLIPFIILVWIFDLSVVGRIMLSLIFALLISHLAFEIDKKKSSEK